jgi:hypothetical protein
MNLGSSDREASAVPNELTGPLPRTVLLSDGDARYLLVIVLLFFVGGSLALGWEFFSDSEQFQQRGALRSDHGEAVGTITRQWSSGRGSVPHVRYTFTAGGTTYSGEARVPRHAGIILNASDRIFIRFLPSNPAINHPDAWEWSPLMGLDQNIFLVFFWTMGGLALAFLLRDRKLAREGQATAAVVTSCPPRDRYYRVSYEFHTEDGILIPGHSDSKVSYETGSRLWILYLPRRPRRNHTYPLSFFEVVG